MPAVKKVLIVEDNQLNREILSGILSQEYRILEAENGKAALEILKEQGEDISIIPICVKQLPWLTCSARTVSPDCTARIFSISVWARSFLNIQRRNMTSAALIL